MKNFFLWSLLILVFLFLSIRYFKKRECDKYEDAELQVVDSCAISVYSYNQLNYFCDNQEYWERISQILKKTNYSKSLDSRKTFPVHFWGIKQLQCGDNNEYSDFDDPSKIFLCVEQDTLELIYSGMMTQIDFGTDVVYSPKIKSHDAGKQRKIVKNQESIIIEYLLNYEEVNVKILQEFRHSVNFDLNFARNNKKAHFRLINRENNKCLASFRYLDYGERFYFDVYE